MKDESRICHPSARVAGCDHDRRAGDHDAASISRRTVLHAAAIGIAASSTPGKLLAAVSEPDATVEAAERFPFFQSTPVSYRKVQMQDTFWAPRQKIVREVTVPWATRFYDAAGGLDEYKKAPASYHAKPQVDDLVTIAFTEAMASVVGLHRDPAIESLIDAWAKVLIKGQGSDGYLQTGFPQGGADHPEKRWEPQWYSHECWTVGKYIESAIAYHEATGNAALYESAVRAADNMAAAFLGTDRAYAPGHAEIEQALTRLYGLTGNKKYLQLCGWLIAQRGHHERRPNFTQYSQDHTPLENQRTIEGHAVRAAFFFNGATEYVAATGNMAYREALLAVWDDFEKRKMYLHGAGANASTKNEGYSTKPYFIPPSDTYGESCSVVANFQWAHNLFRLTGEARYLDTAERMLYNAFYASLSLQGDSYFYCNYAEVGEATRRWTDTPYCCPPNIVKLFSKVGGFFYSTDRAGIWVKHYGASEADIPFGVGVKLIQRTDYPWSGDITLRVEPKKPTTFDLRLRLPAWATSHSLSVNGRTVRSEVEKGWLTVRGHWKAGDEVKLSLPMNIVRVTMPPQFKEYRNLAALERGPIVYCLEQQDIEDENASFMAPDRFYIRLDPFYIPEGASFSAEHRGDFLGGVTVLVGHVQKINTSTRDSPVRVMFVPYGVWNNRQPGAMRIWLGARKVPLIETMFPLGPPGPDATPPHSIL